MGLSDKDRKAGIGHLDFLDAILAIHVSVIGGVLLNEAIASAGLTLPLFVTCLFVGGISLGSTPTAMANTTAVTQRFGTSHMAFIVVPLVCAFFIDLVNAALIPFFLNHF